MKTTPTFSAEPPRLVIDRPAFRLNARGGRNFDWDPITQRFLMVKDLAGPPPPAEIVVVLDWADQLKARFNAAAAKRAP